LLKFLELTEEHLELVLRWRTSPEVTRYMFTDIPYSMDNQVRWFQRVSRDETSRYWVIALQGKLVGLVSLNEIDRTNMRCSWAFYIGEPEGRLIGGMLAPYVYFYAFEVLGLNKVVGEVLEGNDNVRKMHLIQGCREVGVYRGHIFKNGHFFDVYLYEYLRQDWLANRDKYNKMVSADLFE